MKLVAEGQSAVVLDDGGPYFMVFVPNDDRISEYVRKEEQPNYLAALEAKWGFVLMDEEVTWDSFEPTEAPQYDGTADHLNEILIGLKSVLEAKRARAKAG